MKKKKLKTIPKLKKEVWSTFSKMIRVRDALITTGTKTRAKCVTCGVLKDIKEMDGGHFTQGRHNTVLFDERNVHAQCQQCNRFLHGNLIPYYEFMLDRYGKGVIDELKATNKGIKNFTRDELNEMMREYKELTELYLTRN